jgi:hydrogenase nickel incorporation protein HypB
MKRHKKLYEPLLDELTQKGNEIHTKLIQHQVFSLNIMASPGAGKTSIILKTIQQLASSLSIAVIEGDVVPIDVETIQRTGVPVELAQTGGSCHLDSLMIETALHRIDIQAIDLLIVENVGNLICPANFYLGTDANVVIASVPEGSDKPLKYPTMFQGADVVLLNKIDYLRTEPFDVEQFTHGVHQVAPTAPIIPLSCRTEEGVLEWIKWITTNIPAEKKNKWQS